MIEHMSFSSVNVSDQDVALEFWVDKVGFEKRMDAPMGEGARWLVVAPPGRETGVLLQEGFGGWEPGKVGGFAPFAFRVEDMRATYEQLKGKGVEFDGEPTEEEYGSQAIMHDPDGNRFVMVEPVTS